MHIKKVLLVSVIAAVLSACAPNYDNMSYSELVSNAKTEMANAKKMRYLWRDTGKILKKAEKAHKKGDEAKAKKLARLALDQALLAQKQAKAQAHPKVAFN
ncbi:MAG: hypothetical protein R3188_01295 [Acidiferrobacterales bacterium]|jgi:HSP90 family molecular chaperone|nr:hypothetical protein [Acidiferrobacterales bacterium]